MYIFLWYPHKKLTFGSLFPGPGPPLPALLLRWRGEGRPGLPRRAGAGAAGVRWAALRAGGASISSATGISIYRSIYPSIHPIYIYLYQSISIYLSTVHLQYIYLYLYLYLYQYLYLYLSISISIYLYLYLSISISILIYIYPNLYLS